MCKYGPEALCTLQAASRAQAVTASLVQSVADANTAHQAHLEAAAKSQTEATATLRSAVHSGLNQVRQRLPAASRALHVIQSEVLVLSNHYSSHS